MPETDPGQEPEEFGVVYAFVATVDSRGVPDGKLTVVTEDGRALRVTGIRHPGGDVDRIEIVVAKEGA